MNLSYLDPKIDMVFKRIFSRADLLKDFLNAVLPLDTAIESLEYLPTEQTPKIPQMRFSIVDVKCRDKKNQIFVVEMQMLWTDAWFSRILFSGAQAIVNQLSAGEPYKELCPVYSVTVLNDVFEKDPGEKERWLHHYKITKLSDHGKVLKGLQFVILELPKFTPQTKTEKQVTALWLRFLRETGQPGFIPDSSFMSYQPVADAVKMTEFKGYSAAEIDSYQKYLDALRNEKSILLDTDTKARTEGKAEGRAEGLAEGIEKGIEQGRLQEKLALARNLLLLPLDEAAIAQASGLPVSAIEKLRQES